MEEGNAPAAGASAGHLANCLQPSGTAAVQGRVQVWNPQGYMVESRAASAEEASHWRIVAGGLEQLDSAGAELEEGEPNLLRADVLFPGVGASEKLREDGDRGVQVLDGDRDVVEVDFTVHREPGVPKRCC